MMDDQGSRSAQADRGLADRIRTILLSPWAILAGVLVGLYLGSYRPDLVPVVAPVGQIFLSTLKMCVLPILVSAIAASLGPLIKTQTGGAFLGRMLTLFLAAMIAASALGMLAGLAGRPGEDLGPAALDALGSHVTESKYAPDIEINLKDPGERAQTAPSVREILDTLIPKNIFHALANERHLQVLFFAILFGTAIGFLPDASSGVLIGFLDAMYKAFSILVAWLRYLLPVGLCGLMAQQFAETGAEILVAMGKFLAVALLPFVALLVLGIGVIRLRSRRTLGQVVSSLKEPVIIALGTGASLPAIPSSLSAMTKGLGFDKDRVDLLVPLGITVFRFGNMVYFAVATLFVAQLYQTPTGPLQLIVVVLGSVVAGMATAGTSGIMTLVMLGLVLKPLALPLDAVLALFIVIDPVVGPLRAMTNVQMNLALSSLVAGRTSAEAQE